MKELDNNIKSVDQKKIKQRLKFVEILLIVGGILGSLGLENEETILLILFLISSLSYYTTVSNFHKNSEWTKFVIFIEGSTTAILFSSIAISLVKSDVIPDSMNITLGGLLVVIILRELGFYDHLTKKR